MANNPANISPEQINYFRKQVEERLLRGSKPGSYADLDWSSGSSFIVSDMAQTMIKELEAKAPESAKALAEARETIKELEDTFRRIQEEPLILFNINRITKDKKFTYVRKGDQEIRIEAVKDLEVGDEVLLHPKSMQIVERLGRPPLEASRFAVGTIPNVTWDDIGGLEDAKADMIEAIEMPHKYKEIFKYYNKRPVKGILLSGPPGCGKTMLGKAAARCLAEIYGAEGAKTGFMYVKGPEILNQYVGASEETIRNIFFDARRHKEEHGYPAVVFIDEADAILACRGTRNVGIGNTIVPMFLTEMDGMEDSCAVVILATNRPDVLDPAVVREGRIDRKVTVTRPNQSNAQSILAALFAKNKLHKDYTAADMAETTAEIIYDEERIIRDDVPMADIVNGAMLAAIVDLCVSTAIRRDIAAGGKKRSGIKPEDVLAAIERTQVQNRDVKFEIGEVV